ncbi:helix-turn-helix domain-containing protein [Burkholderia pseudomallei]|uniref:helix-turn-helix domain-containing protein n=1 Tax=Burkholderia pseudomallei TaxID=28450 RepID=UPI00052A668D|nr:helix-turn-helix domain-containing protein [Burkholderia pseudomallei]AIV49385.1 merR HTH regulatory family protein [Burkholderia pseudomallei TSV 48]
MDLADLPDVLTTSEAAKALRRSPSTLRMWLVRDNAPIRPVVSLCGHHLWRRDDVERLLRGESVKRS